MSAKLLSVLGFAIAVAGCAATGPRYSDHIAAFPAVEPRTTRVTVFRTTDSLLLHARSATVKVDGAQRGGCEFGGYLTFHVPAGHHVLSVGMWDAPGACSLSIDVIGGEEYFYAIAPRSEQFVAGFLGSMLGGIGQLAAAGAESSGRTCGGPFSIVRVDDDTALRKLDTLRLSQ
ncbi:MAG: hypothetical protein U1F15_06135 [Burkholderiales bacterium]